jgi:acyl-homoserine lactone acylase PvdQ
VKFRPLLIAAVLTAFLLPALVSASSTAPKLKEYASVALDVLAPGEASDSGPNSTDQLQLYDGLTPLWNAVSTSNLRKYFKPETFGIQGKPVRVEETGRKGVRIARDKWGVAHVTGKTRADVMFGAGWVTGEDRNLLLQIIRGPARIAALDVPGLDAFGLALSGRAFVPSQQAEDFLAAQAQLLHAQGAKGDRILKEVDAFAAGLNAYLAAAHIQIPPWNRNDVIAAAALIGGIFGVAGGDEVRRSEFLDALQQRLGGAEGRTVWDDLRQVKDPSSPVSVPGSFPYGEAGGSAMRGNAVVDDGSFQPFEPGGPMLAPKHSGERSMSNALLVSARRSVSHHPIFVAGPQVGYYWPEFFLELDLHGGGLDTRGAVFPGVPYVVIGRGKDYAWSAQSSHSDIVDQFVETLCGGDDLHYLYKGECRAMGTFDAGLLKGRAGQPDRRLIFHTTVHGPVGGYAKVNGARVAISSDRSTRGRELMSAFAFSDLNSNKVTSAQSFYKVMNQEEFSFNWVYADNKDIAYFSAARLPKRALGVDIGLPTIGTGAYDWQGFEPLKTHARATNPKSGYILGWNNRPALDYSAPDDQWSWGSIQRVQLLQAAISRYRVQSPASVVGAMNEAATQDARMVLVWPAVKVALTLGGESAPNARDAQMVAILDAWLSRGASRLDGDLNGEIDDPGAAVMDAAWPKIADAVLSGRIGPLTDRLAELIPRDDNANNQGSAYDSGWYGYVKDDLDWIFGVHIPEATPPPLYCGAGNPAACRSALWAAIGAAGDELAAAQGSDPSAWHADATTERIQFQPGLLGKTMRWTNRPTFQQVISFNGHRPR